MDLRKGRFPIEETALDGSLDRQQAMADYVPFDRGQNYNGDSAARKILLERHGSVAGEEDLESVVLGCSQEFAAFHGPTSPGAYRECFMTGEIASQAVRKILVKRTFTDSIAPEGAIQRMQPQRVPERTSLMRLMLD